MSPSEFITLWNSEVATNSSVMDDQQLVTAPSPLLLSPSIPVEDARFLVEAGLPSSCAPFLSFDHVSDGPLSIVDSYGAHQFRPGDLSRLARYYVLGHDGAGNPLCLDITHHSEIVMLDHEDNFRTSTFVASSVAKLANAILILRGLLYDEVVSYDKFVEQLRQIDPPAAESSSFLPQEVAMLSD